ncbi:MAG: CrcB family protein [Actinomycetota bacterium]
MVRSRYESGLKLLVIGIGGALGATARLSIDEIAATTFWDDGNTASWPWPTLIVNLIGCALIGLAAAFIEPTSRTWTFAVTGVLGGFTTYSAFAVEVDQLVDGGRAALAVVYVAVTLLGGVSATVAGARRATEPPVPRQAIE